MAVLETYTHDPDAKLDYSVDWSLWLADGDTVQASTWAVSPSGPTLSGSSINVPATITTIFFDGGTEGERYTLTNHIVTTEGREDDRSIRIKVVER